LNCRENWKKICAEVKGILKTDSDVEVAFIEENKPTGMTKLTLII